MVLVPLYLSVYLGRIEQTNSVKMAIRRTEKGFLHEQGLNRLKSPPFGKGKIEGKSVMSQTARRWRTGNN